MKKILSVFLVLIVFIGLLSMSALADEDPTIRVSTTEAEPGDTITVEVSLENNPGIMAFVLGIEYDQTRLEKVKFTHTGLQGLWAMSENAVWVGNGDSTYEGVFLNLKFRVLEDAPSGDAVVTLTYGEGGICNYDEENVDFAVAAGGVTVTGGTVESTPKATEAPEATKSPETTTAPEATKAPEATDKPATADAPVSTNAPENTETTEETERPADADENKSAEEEAAPAALTESVDEPGEPEDGAVEVFAEASHTAPVLENETGSATDNETDSSRSNILMLIIVLAVVAVVLIAMIIVILVKKSSYHGRH